MKKFKKLKFINTPWTLGRKNKLDNLTNTTVISINEQRKSQYYESDNFMKCFRRQTDEEKRRVAIMTFSFYKRLLMQGEITDYIVEEHFNLLDEKNKKDLIELLNSDIDKELKHSIL